MRRMITKHVSCCTLMICLDTFSVCWFQKVFFSEVCERGFQMLFEGTACTLSEEY